MPQLGRLDLERLCVEYYAACNAGDAAAIEACFVDDAVHYFPLGGIGPLIGARAIAATWVDAVTRLDSRWTIDHLIVDVEAREVVIEWTHWKPMSAAHLRGLEVCRFADDGPILEIRATYAAPATSDVHELGSFPYASRGYAVDPPLVPGRADPGHATKGELT